jgi:hypothetical protein
VGRRIVVTGMCQTFGLVAALRAMLPDDTVVASTWQGVDWQGDVPTDETPLLRVELEGTHTWVTVAPKASRAVLGERSRTELVTIPLVHFGAFHPDLVYGNLPSGGVVQSAVGDYNSAIVVWGWKHGLDCDQILVRFNRQTMIALGYTRQWAAAVDALRVDVNRTDIDFASLFLPLRRGDPFMLASNHPRIEVLIGIARQIASRLGSSDERLSFPWSQVLPDWLLANAQVWPIYPAVAEALGVRGGFVWRHSNGRLLSLAEFVSESLDAYRSVDPADVKVPVLDDPRFGVALSAKPGSPP